MRDTELRELADADYVASTRILTEQSCRAGRCARIDGFVLTSTGTKVGWLNIAFAVAAPADLEAAFSASVEFYADADEPWLMRIPEGRMPEVEAAAASRGFRATDYVPGLVLVPMPQPTTSAVFDIRPVVDAAGLDAFASILAECFGIDAVAARDLVSDRLPDAPDVAAFLAYTDGVPVATSMMIRDGDVGGIWCIATLDAYRGRGIGEAVTRRAVDEGTRRGCRAANLQASEQGLPIYERMGFRTVSRYHTYLPPGLWGELV